LFIISQNWLKIGGKMNNENNQRGNISRVSNELEFNLYNVNAETILNNSDLPIVSEVNLKNILELNISLANDVDELNRRLYNSVNDLRNVANDLGGDIYSGSSLIADVSNLEPARYRTTCLSESCARGFLNINSQQIVIGVQGEEYGINLFNYLRTINPIILALSNSSPYVYQNNELIDTNNQSTRISSYRNICKSFPNDMLFSQDLTSIEHYHEILQNISNQVLDYLSNDMLDVNMPELTRERENGSYFPFQSLEPHQIYWMTRFRPDHANEDSDFSIELRVADIPINTRQIQTINSFVLGLCYYTEQNGFNLPRIYGNEFENLEIAARDGLNGNIKEVFIRDYVNELLPYAVEGLNQRNCDSHTLINNVNHILDNGNSSEILRRQNFQNPNEMINYLITDLID